MNLEQLLADANASIAEAVANICESDNPMTHWTKGGTVMTAFTAKDLPLYERALVECGDENLFLCFGPMKSDAFTYKTHMLCCKNPVRSIDHFWCIFDRIRNVPNPQPQTDNTMNAHQFASELAESITVSIMEDDPVKCTRIALKAGSYAEGTETDQGGYCRAAFKNALESRIRNFIATNPELSKLIN